MKVSIVGIGRVGSTLAYTLCMQRFVRELVLVNRSPGPALGDALDLDHGQLFLPSPTEVVAGNVADTHDSDVIAICASVPMPRKGDTVDRLALGPGNAALLRELLPPLAAASPNAIVILLTNPVDVLTWLAIGWTGFPPSRVIGTGTLVDSARFRWLLSRQLQIHPDDLRAYVLGEHGDSQFAAMSIATAGGEPIDDTPERRKLFQDTIEAGLEVFKLKGYTNYAVAMAAAEIISAIAHDEKRTMPLSTAIDGYLGVDDVCLSLPVVVGKGGIERVFHPKLNADEQAAFLRSAAIVRESISRCQMPDARCQMPDDMINPPLQEQAPTYR
jgi:L-lactate dehydrogenase